MPIVRNRFSKRAGGHSGPPLRRGCVVSLIFKTKQPHIAMRGGMWSGWAASRTFQPTGECKQVDIRRLAGRVPSTMVITSKSLPNDPVVTIGDGRPTWPPDVTAKPSRTDRSMGFRVTSGDLGTHAMHPPRKRESIGTNATHPPGKRIIHINKCQDRIDTRGRIRRSAPTQRICPMVRDSKFGNGIFVTSGEIGACAMHPPGKRSNNINVQPIGIDTRGRTRRSAPTRSSCRKPYIQDETNGQRDARWNVE